jgi:dTDP-4-dehydrorhamnose 3,5-epimerase-like enzyme
VARTRDSRRMTLGLPTLAEVRIVKLPCYSAENGALVVMQAGVEVPFQIARVFVVHGNVGTIRGQHAHKECAQFFTCSSGSIEVLCDDGATTACYRLERPDVGLLVPHGIWSQQTYLMPGTVLTVLCDRSYDHDDYVREYDQFQMFRQLQTGALQT